MKIGFYFRIILSVFVLTASILLLSLDSINSPVGAANSPSIALGTTLIGEGDDFATRVLGLPWDMRGDPYPDYPTTFFNFDRSSFVASGDLWSIDGLFDPNVWLHSPGIKDTQKVLRLGDKFPIDADKYHLFSTRICSDVSDGGVVYWYLDQLGEVPLRIGYWNPAFSVNIGCELYVIDLSDVSHQQDYAWAGMIKGFRFDPINFTSPSSIDLDWARLTSVDTTNVVPVQWSGISSGTNLDFYLNTNCSLADAMPLGIVARGGAQSGTFNWGSSLLPNGDPSTPYPLPESFEPDTYNLLMQIDGSGPVYCASEALEIRKAPTLTFQKPSMNSGPDYAEELLNDPWGMSNAGDVDLMNNIQSSTFSGGLWEGTTTAGGDAWIHLNLASNIDTSQYKYVSYRMWLEGEAAASAQFLSVHRWIWWDDTPVNAVATEDMLIREGWQTYSFDLSQALIDPSSPPGSGWNGSPIVFRMDLHEEVSSIDFHLDYIALRGENKGTIGNPYPVVYNLSPTSGVTPTFYYDTDSDPDNGGRTLMVQYPSSTYQIFIPIGLKNYDGSPILEPEINLLYGDRFWWDTSTVPAATYFVSVDLFDGINTTTWYSEVPIILTN